MENQIIKLDEKNRKVLGYNDKQIIFSSKNHKSFDTLLDAAKKSGMLETVMVIPTDMITAVEYNDRSSVLTLRYLKDGKDKKNDVGLSDKAQRDAIAEGIADMRQLQKTVATEVKTKPLIMNALGLLAILFFTWVFRGMALDAEQGEHFVATGRRSGIKQLFANAVEAIGPTGVLIIGILGFLLMVYATYNRYNNPASEIRYS